MSGDVTAAIERDLGQAREAWSVGRGVFNTESDATCIDRILDAAVPALLAEVERLRAEVEQQSMRADEAEMWDVRRGDNPIEQENARLRAEREALHSDETHDRLARIFIANARPAHSFETLRERAAPIYSDALHAADQTIALLSAGSEADE